MDNSVQKMDSRRGVRLRFAGEKGKLREAGWETSLYN